MRFEMDIDMVTGIRDSDDVADIILSELPKVTAVMGEDGNKGVIRKAGEDIGQWSFHEKPKRVLYMPNDPDPTPAMRKETERGTCDRTYYDSDGDSAWYCTMPDGHDGTTEDWGDPRHIAGNGRSVVAVWCDLTDV